MKNITGWGIQPSLNIQGWGGDIVSDSYNEIGMDPDATDFYDLSLDIIEPPNPLWDWASLYFPHPEWNNTELGDNFTSDYRELRDLSNQLSIWNGEFISDVPGPAQLVFNFINNAGGWPIYCKLQETPDSDLFTYYKILILMQ